MLRKLGLYHGSRTLRGCVSCGASTGSGGVSKDFVSGKENSILKQLDTMKKELEDTVDIIMHNSMFHDRIEKRRYSGHENCL